MSESRVNMTKKELAEKLGISRKTLYNYLDILNIKEINDFTIDILEKYSKNKSKSKEVSKTELLQELEEIKIKNLELSKKNEFLENGQKALLDQIEYFKNELEPRIKAIENNLSLLTYKEPPKKKKSFISRFFD